MRFTFWLCSALVGASFLAGQAETPGACPQTKDDPYTLAFVKSAFESFTNQGVWGGQIHQFNNNSPGLPQLGDAVSIGVLKLYSLDELVSPANTRSYLRLVVYGFSDRKRVLEKSDQEPRITSLVLDYIEQKRMSNPVLRKQIAYIRECVKNFSCSFQNEAEFTSSH
jgi:hypothetical protein